MNFMPLLLSLFAQADGLSLGPFLGHVDHHRAFVWVRVSSPGTLLLKAGEQGQELNLRVEGVADVENDLTVSFELNGLSPSFAYEYVSLCAKPGPPARPQNAYLVVLVMQFDKQREREETFKGDL